jgi:hypothetical protein
MAMVGVGVVLVSVRQRGVRVLVPMPPARGEHLAVEMLMLMVLVVSVPMVVRHRVMSVLMLVPLGEMQPNPETHKCGGDDQWDGDRLTKSDGDDGAEERCD